MVSVMRCLRTDPGVFKMPRIGVPVATVSLSSTFQTQREKRNAHNKKFDCKQIAFVQELK